MSSIVARLIPTWLRQYQLSALPTDLVAGIVVGVLVIPQSLGYAVLAGLPPVYGLYAAIVPVLVYAWLGSSNVQAVGPVAITAIMTASGLLPYAEQGTEQYALMASLLALMVGALLWIAGRLKLGWIMQFISRGVSAGFVSGAAVLIFISQLKYLTDIPITGNSLIGYLSTMQRYASQLHPLTLVIGVTAFALLAANRYASEWIWQTWLSSSYAKWAERLFPLILLIIAILLSMALHWHAHGVATIGRIPQGLPSFTLPHISDLQEALKLLPTAGLMALIVFVSSSSVASTYARLRGERFDANRELTGLGLANLSGGLFQSFAVAGGFSRTAINADSGAKTPLASLVTVLVMIAALIAFSNALAPLPYALLGATIMASIIGLIDIATLKSAWQRDRLDAASFLAAFVGVLIFGLNTGLVIGLMVSFASLIWQSSKPHVAIVGQLGGTGHFRNINRHDVVTFDSLLMLRIDESLFFGNSESVHRHILNAMQQYPQAHEIILIMAAVNHIDLTAQEMLCTLNQELVLQNKRLHFSFIKGPVMDVIGHTPLINELSGQVYLSTLEAVDTLKNI
ncbi:MULTISPECIES: SulP family inorganic anion transporter [unclassified Psychrobacter]|uniref:SulP family inorganic anion transporter n=1 Tax=unclassified Psychrobacter TaxID=196806 RepID=UPI0025B5ACCC|nr:MULTISPECIES: SulP family inorganic anion transporter [unclassified Psychrobacter]MDN3454297.1 SulP family inorganic anion transporter [Psychrobacter sp. APC 3350]MDN3503740.1 SulP family inorganic anion transporter [Psychrobacter sp. 5A.1]